MRHKEPRSDGTPISGATADAIAVGGGLAGSAFALELARHGLNAIIFERTSGAHHKVCGEFLSDGAQALLHYLGIDATALGGNPIETLYLASGARRVRAQLPFKAVGISRLLLDETLLTAAERAGAKIQRATTVERLEACEERVRVHTAGAVFQCRVAALASGKHNIRGLPRSDAPMVGFKMHLRPSEATRALLMGAVHLIAFTGGYLGLCMIENGTLSIAWTVNSQVLQSAGTAWAAQSAYVMRQSPFFEELTSGTSPAWEKPLAVAGLPYGFMRSETIAESIYPVGDQLAVIPSFSGDGTALALASGIAAAQAVLEGESASSFQRRILANYKPQFRRTRILDRIIADERLRRAGIVGAHLFPIIVTTLVSATRLRDLDGLITSAQART